MSPAFHRLLADVVLLIHFGFVLLVVGGQVLICVGGVRGWSWVRHFGFRATHLLAIAVVVGESLGGVVCPLTSWEAKLRALAGEGQVYAGSFIQHWVHRFMFFEASEWTFTLIYLVFFALVVASVFLVRPRWPWARRSAEGKAGLPELSHPTPGPIGRSSSDKR